MRYRIRTFDADRAVLRDQVVQDLHGDGPGFFAHQALHADGVVGVAVWDLDATVDPDLVGDTPVLTRTDPGVSWTGEWS